MWGVHMGYLGVVGLMEEKNGSYSEKPPLVGARA